MIRKRLQWTNLDRDDVVVLYPTFGHFEPQSQTWRIEIRGTVYEAGSVSRHKQMLLRLLQRVAKVQPSESQRDLFERRIREFIAPTEGGKRVEVRLGDHVYRIRKKTKRNGRFMGTVRIPGHHLQTLAQQGHMQQGWLNLHVVSPNGDENGHFAGRVRLLDHRGWSVISDIDDTVKVTDVHCRRSLLANTFLREFRAIEGMAEVYRRWAVDDAAFHYVSSSPWQLFGPLADMLQATGFPDGTFHLRSFRLHHHMLRRLLLIRRRGKVANMHAILKTFPQRRFVLVGDSGERDPEIYGLLARKYPRQVARVFIRELAGRSGHDERYRKAFRRLPPYRCLVFEDAAQLPQSLSQLAAVDAERSIRAYLP